MSSDSRPSSSAVSAVAVAPGNRSKHRKNVLTRMSEVTGSMSRLEECRQSGTRVSVFIRSVKEICAICRGRIIVFDKHWNMVLADVEETYIPRLVLHPHLTRRPTRHRTAIEGLEWKPCKASADDRDERRSAAAGVGRTGAGRPDVSGQYRSLRRSGRVRDRSGATSDSTEETREEDTESEDKIRTKTFKQLFIRGDNIALVSVS